MTSRWLALAICASLILHAPLVAADPILKESKYSGPIPQRSLSLRIGMFGDAGNQEMIGYLDDRIQEPFEVSYEDFGTGLEVDLGYIYKPHPRFGLRLNGSASFISYTSTGNYVPQGDDSLLQELNFDRKLKVELYVLEASGIYFFSDASVNEFQTYFGGGFSVGFPHEVFTQTHTDAETGEPYTQEVPGRPSEASEWDLSAGVHAVLGMVYYITDQWGVSAEARAQYMEGRFDQLEAVDPETGEFENIGFVIDYAGFYLAVGATYGF
jgi:hypothetical protein